MNGKLTWTGFNAHDKRSDDDFSVGFDLGFKKVYEYCLSSEYLLIKRFWKTIITAKLKIRNLDEILQ